MLLRCSGLIVSLPFSLLRVRTAAISSLPPLPVPSLSAAVTTGERCRPVHPSAAGVGRDRVATPPPPKGRRAKAEEKQRAAARLLRRCWRAAPIEVCATGSWLAKMRAARRDDARHTKTKGQKSAAQRQSRGHSDEHSGILPTLSSRCIVRATQCGRACALAHLTSTGSSGLRAKVAFSPTVRCKGER